jgi:hypothetical protein
MANQLTVKNTLLVSTSGTPDADNIITTDNSVIVVPKGKAIDYKDLGNGALGNAKTVVSDDYVTAEFSVDINAKCSGSAGTAPKCAEMFKLCGLEEIVDSDNNTVTYQPTTTSFAKGTALAYLDGSKREVSGISGSFTFGGAVGEIAKFSFSLKGFTTLEEIAEDNPAVTLDVISNLVIESVTTVTIGGDTIQMKDFTFDVGNDIQETYTVGLKEFYIQDFKPTMKVSAIKIKGNQTHWSDLKANTKKKVIIKLGTEDGKIIELTAPYCQPSDVSESDDGGKNKFENTWLCENSAGGDNFSIVYK